jgi:hypothetical protein
MFSNLQIIKTLHIFMYGNKNMNLFTEKLQD